MAQETVAKRPFAWWLPACGLAGAIIVCLPMLVGGYDFGAFILTGLVGLLVCLALLGIVIANIWPRRLAVLAMVVVFVAVGWSLFRVSYGIHTWIRWRLESKSYRAAVMAQPRPADGEFRHVEWDGWGGFGTGDTTVYLVFDPSNSLAAAARNRFSGKIAGIPCPVSSVRRFSSYWYAVIPYTDTDWNQCD